VVLRLGKLERFPKKKLITGIDLNARFANKKEIDKEDIKMAAAKMKKRVQRERLLSGDMNKVATVYKYRYETKKFNYREDAWGSATVSFTSMSCVYEAYEESRSYEW
jgi:transcriptional regulator NrdR family protein